MTDRSAYRETRLIATTLAGKPLVAASRPALDNAADPSPAEELLASQAALQAGQRVLVSPCGRGVLAAWAAAVVGAAQVVAMDTNAIALDLARQTLDANGAEQAAVLPDLPGAEQGLYGCALLSIPKGRQLSRLHLLAAGLALKPGGQLYVAGANNEGIKSVLADAEALLGRGELLAYRKGHRVMRFIRRSLDPAALPPPYDTPGMAPGSFISFDVTVGYRQLALRSRPGVFSHGALDDGTAMLLDNLTIDAADRVLDFGCGVGVIGLVAALTVGAPRVTLTDVDALACQSANATFAANSLAGARVVQADGLANLGRGAFDLIASNPPFHAGHAVNLAITAALVDEAYDCLAVGGRLLLVANRFLPYDRLLQARFGESTTVAANGRYHVLAAMRRSRH